MAGATAEGTKRHGPAFEFPPPFAKPMHFLAGPEISHWANRHGRMYLRARDYVESQDLFDDPMALKEPAPTVHLAHPLPRFTLKTPATAAAVEGGRHAPGAGSRRFRRRAGP